MQNFLGEYSIESQNHNNFVVTFNIPENCEYIVAAVQEINYIIISLKEGFKTPSATFKAHKTEIIKEFKNLVIEFQHEYYKEKYMEGSEIPKEILRSPKITLEF